MPDRTTASIDNVFLSKSELFMYYYEITESQDKYLNSLKCIDNRYL